MGETLQTTSIKNSNKLFISKNRSEKLERSGGATRKAALELGRLKEALTERGLIPPMPVKEKAHQVKLEQTRDRIKKESLLSIRPLRLMRGQNLRTPPSRLIQLNRMAQLSIAFKSWIKGVAITAREAVVMSVRKVIERSRQHLRLKHQAREKDFGPEL